MLDALDQLVKDKVRLADSQYSILKQAMTLKCGVSARDIPKIRLAFDDCNNRNPYMRVVHDQLTPGVFDQVIKGLFRFFDVQERFHI